VHDLHRQEGQVGVQDVPWGRLRASHVPHLSRDREEEVSEAVLYGSCRVCC
jgi:hypothetical protein